MRAITKGREPRSLIQHRATPHSDYSNYAGTDDLREALVRDQQGLCCYCMNRIEATSEAMKVEHWSCQSDHGENDLAYWNLLAACLGGHGQPKKKQHCDTRKGDDDLKFNPADPTHRIEQRIRFESDGTIASSDDEFNTQLNDVLNLNLPLLKNRRKGVLTAILDWWKSEKARLRGPVPTEQIARERARRAGDGAGPLRPFEPVAVWWLDQCLARRAT